MQVLARGKVQVPVEHKEQVHKVHMDQLGQPKSPWYRQTTKGPQISKKISMQVITKFQIYNTIS